MRPGDLHLDKPFYVSQASGSPATGLATGDFTFSAWHTPYGGATATWAHAAVVTELGAGWYRVRLTPPTTAGEWSFAIAHATHIVTPFGWQDELENYDRDSLAGLISRPVLRLDSSGTLGESVQLRPIICKRRAVITIGVLDADGDPAPIDSDYTNWKVGFRSQQNQNLTPPRLDAVDGTPDGFGLAVSAGLIVITIPDDCSIFGALPEGASPADSVTIDLEVTAERPAGQTWSIVAPSPLQINKRAEGSGT